MCTHEPSTLRLLAIPRKPNVQGVTIEAADDRPLAFLDEKNLIDSEPRGPTRKPTTRNYIGKRCWRRLHNFRRMWRRYSSKTWLILVEWDRIIFYLVSSLFTDAQRNNTLRYIIRYLWRTEPLFLFPTLAKYFGLFIWQISNLSLFSILLCFRSVLFQLYSILTTVLFKQS